MCKSTYLWIRPQHARPRWRLLAWCIQRTFCAPNASCSKRCTTVAVTWGLAFMILASNCCNTYMVMQWWFRQAELASGGTSPLYLQALYVMWSKSFRSDDLQLPAIDLTADTSAATSSSPPDAEPDTEDKMRTRPSKRSKSDH